MTFSEQIKHKALELGFDACGICRATDSEQEANYMDWLANECQGGMNDMGGDNERRFGCSLYD